MKDFLKENIALVAGIALPIVLIAFFFIAERVAQETVPDPQYSALFAVNYNKSYDNQPYAIALEDGRLAIRKTKDVKDNAYIQKPELYLFDRRTLFADKVEIDFDHPDKDGTISSPTLDALNRRAITPGPASPDGYRFEYDSRYRSGLFGEIFGMGHTSSYYALVRPPRSIPVKGPQAIYQAEFLGWVADE